MQVGRGSEVRGRWLSEAAVRRSEEEELLSWLRAAGCGACVG